MAIYKNDPRYYSCYSPKLTDFLVNNGFNYIETFKNLETKKHCWIFENSEEMSKYLKQWSEKKIKKF